MSLSEQCADWRIVVYQTATSGAGIWAILYGFDITPFVPGAAVAPSDSASVNSYILGTSSSKRIVYVAFEGDKCYIKGIFSAYPNDWIVGTVKDNVLSIEANQLLVNDPIYYERVGFGVEDGYTASYDVNYKRLEAATFTVSDDKTTITPENSELCILETDFEGSYVYQALSGVSFTKFDVKPAVPATPEILGWDDDPGYESLIVKIPNETSDGEFANSEWLTYTIVMDDKVYTFTKDKYTGISENMTAIPYDYSDDNWEIISSGSTKRLSIKDLDWTTIGVFSTYTVNGVSNNSQTAYYSLQSAVKDIVTDSNEEVEYFNLQGIRLNGNNIPKGVVIKRQGNKVMKVVVK
jgi:hypothetical protein